MSGERPRRWTHPVWVGSAAVLLALVGRTVWSGYGALADGRRALEAGRELEATVALREATSWYLPKASWREQAMEELWSLHERQLEAERLQDAVRTLQALRGGARAARSVLAPDAAWRERVNDRLAELMARWEARDGGGSEGRAALERRHRRLLRRDERPARGWGLLCVLGFGLWVGAALSAIASDGARRWRWLGGSAAGFTAFVVGLLAA